MVETKTILTVNCGSSSLKFALYRARQRTHRAVSQKSQTSQGWQETQRYAGVIERIGMADGLFHVTGTHANAQAQPVARQPVQVHDHSAALHYVLDWLEPRMDGRSLDAVGHRVVHGGSAYEQPQRITSEVIETLRRIAPLAPLHMPIEIAAIETIRARYPSLPQVASFDTAFHRTMPRIAQLFGLPRTLLDDGVLRYGFHGLSYEYIMSELEREASDAKKSLAEYAGQRIVIAHLGNGASMVAVHDGRSVDTTMGLTPIGGLVMSTRSGDLDPGVLLYLLDAKQMTSVDIRQQVEQAGGLLGVSGRSADMRELLDQMAHDTWAEEAVALFSYSARKHLGALVSVLGGIDTLVFTGGIGEHAATVRHRICGDLGYLGLKLDPARNATDAPIISVENSPVAVRVIHTNEELMIARHTLHALSVI